MSRYAVQRVGSAALIFGTALLAARELGPQRYGDVAMFLFLTKMLLIGNLGSVSGYLFNAYASESIKTGCEGYIRAYGNHLVLLGIIALCISLFLSKVYALSVIAFILLIPWHVIEPVLRVERLFHVSLLPDVILSMSVISSLLIVRILPEVYSEDSTSILLITLSLIPISYAFLHKFYRSHGAVLKQAFGHASLENYLNLLRRGFPLYVGTLAFVCFQLVDRLFLEHFHQRHELGVYMLAYQLATGATLLLAAQNFVGAIDIGENLADRSLLRKAYQRQLRAAFKLGAIGMFGLVFVAYILELFFLHEYQGLTMNTIFIGIGLSVFSISGSVSGVAFYRRRQAQLTGAIFLVIGLSIVHNIFVLMMEMNTKWLAFFSGMWMLLYGVFAIRHSGQSLD